MTLKMIIDFFIYVLKLIGFDLLKKYTVNMSI